jgi:4-hydroxy-2-oxoheptanedioate aldolase
MRLRSNLLKPKLASGEPVIGTFLEIPSPQIVELLGIAGFDFVIVDCEHGAIGLERTEDLIRAAASTSISPMVRVAACDPVLVRQPLDMGAAGIHVPQIGSHEAAVNAVRYSSFHPRGDRGMQPFVRGASYRSYPTAEYLRSANEDRVLVVHLEAAECLTDLDRILEIDGIDVVFIGPYDLSQSLGVPGEVEHSKVVEMMTQIAVRARESNRIIGTFCDTPEIAARWRDAGVQYLALSVDANLFLDGARRFLAPLR